MTAALGFKLSCVPHANSGSLCRRGWKVRAPRERRPTADERSARGFQRGAGTPHERIENQSKIQQINGLGSARVTRRPDPKLFGASPLTLGSPQIVSGALETGLEASPHGLGTVSDRLGEAPTPQGTSPSAWEEGTTHEKASPATTWEVVRNDLGKSSFDQGCGFRAG